MLTAITTLLFLLLCVLIFIGSELRWISKVLAALMERSGIPKVN